MRRIVFLMVTLFMMGGVVMAQGQRDGKKMDPKARAEQMTERMVKGYSLNDAQKKQLLELNLAQVQKMGERMSSMHSGKKDAQKAPEMTKEDRQKMRDEMKANSEAYNAQLQKIMTKEQYDSYTKKKAEQNRNQKKDRKRK